MVVFVELCEGISGASRVWVTAVLISMDGGMRDARLDGDAFAMQATMGGDEAWQGFVAFVPEAVALRQRASPWSRVEKIWRFQVR